MGFFLVHADSPLKRNYLDLKLRTFFFFVDALSENSPSPLSNDIVSVLKLVKILYESLLTSAKKWSLSYIIKMWIHPVAVHSNPVSCGRPCRRDGDQDPHIWSAQSVGLKPALSKGVMEMQTLAWGSLSHHMQARELRNVSDLKKNVKLIFPLWISVDQIYYAFQVVCLHYLLIALK